MLAVTDVTAEVRAVVERAQIEKHMAVAVHHAPVLFFIMDGDGTLTVVKQNSSGKFEVAQKVQTRQGARTMALDPATHTVYLPTAEFAEGGGRRAAPKPDSFSIVVVAPVK